jgi:hypothetical protein
LGTEQQLTIQWMAQERPIYLIMSSAGGGHGTRQANHEYRERLQQEHNAITISIPKKRSPKMNAQDLTQE